MKSLVLALVALLQTLTLCAQASVTFKVHYSEPYATYDFLTKISDNYPDNELKQIFERSKYNTPALRQQIAGFEQLPLDYTYAFRQYPTPLKAGLMSRDLLERNLAISKDADECLNRSLGIIPNEDLTAFTQTLKTFLPIYRELVSAPNKESVLEQKNGLGTYVTRGLFNRFFDIGLTFYGSRWDSGIPFEICVQPSFEKDNLRARAFFNVAICEPPLHLKDHNAFFSVAMHEIYHILYDNQSAALKSDLQTWFEHTGSPNRQYALLLLNEALATALGNGYLMEAITGKIEETDWYADKYIGAMAREIYPVVKKYITEKKQIDEAFVKAYVTTYDSKFLSWAKELDHLFAYRYIVADTSSDWSYLRSTYRKYAYSKLAAPISSTEIEKAKASNLTKIFVLSKAHKQSFGLLQSYFEELQHEKPDLSKEFIRVLTLKDQTHLLIINRHQSTVETLMNQYFPGKRLP